LPSLHCLTRILALFTPQVLRPAAQMLSGAQEKQ
jgi:hypothetical protein